MNERTYLLKFINCPIDKGEIIVPYIDDNAFVTVEIVSKYFNYKDYKYEYTCTNCYKIEKLGDTLNGIVIDIYKIDKNYPITINWFVYRK